MKESILGIEMLLLSTEETTSLMGDIGAVQRGKEAVETLTDTGYLKGVVTNALPGFVNFGLNVLWAILIYLLGKKLIKQIRKILRKTLTKSSMDAGVIQFIDSIVNAALYLIVVLIILDIFNIDTTSVAAIVAASGVAIGLAFQNSLSNFAGGVLLLILHPFKIGDYILEDTKNNEGTVKKIDLFYTVLLSSDNKIITIPNGILANSSLTNISGMEERRLDETISISYDSDLKLAKSLLETILNSDAHILKDKEITVYVNNLSDVAVILGYRGWFHRDDFWNSKCSIMEQIKYAFDENQIIIPAQQVDVRMKNREQ